MSAPILLTKLFIPATRPELVSRPRLTSQLNQGLYRKLTLISAPAGFGKTTVATEWLYSNGDDASPPFFVAWLSLDEGDNDAARFLTYLISTLNRIPGLDINIGGGALQMLQSPQPPPVETVLAALINEVTLLSEKIVLILDDYHLINSQPVHDGLQFLLENLPPQLHLVITTREDPPISISRLRVRGQLNEMRASDLRFTLEETSNFLNLVMGLNLSEDDIAALETRTEGWIAGLQLAALSMQGLDDVTGFIHSFTGSNRMILDYLIEEVLDQQSEAVQAFLLQTAILNRLTGSLCDALTGQDDGQVTLEALEHANLFIIPLDDERRWYRYHHLFADLLKRRFNKTQSDQVTVLHRKAGKWFEAQGFISEALEHIFASSDFAWAGQLLEEIGSDMIWKEGDSLSLQRWMEKIPKDIVHSRPELCLISGWLYHSADSPEPFEPYLESVQAYLASEGRERNNDDLSGQKRTAESRSVMSKDAGSMRAEIATIRGVVAARNGDLSRSIEQYKLALEVVPEDNLFLRAKAIAGLAEYHFFRGEVRDAHRLYAESHRMSLAGGYIHWGSSIALSRLANTQRRLGQLHQAMNTYEQMKQVFANQVVKNIQISGYACVGMGQIFYAWNELDNAEQQSHAGIDYGKKVNNLRILTLGHLALARTLQAQGDAVGAMNTMQDANEIWQNYNLSRWTLLPSVAAYQAWLSLVQGDIAPASQWAQEKGLDPDGELLYQYERDFITLARLFVAQGEGDKALELLQRLLSSAVQGGRIAREIEILALQSISIHEQGNLEQALTVLKKALTLAEPGGFMRVFVDEGPPMARLLYESLSSEIAPDYVRKLLVAFPKSEPEKAEASHQATSGSVWIEPLTDRELEILHYVAEGLTNPDISNRLYLSPNTIKTHLRNIFGKLDVSNRTQAVAKGRTLGILSDR